MQSTGKGRRNKTGSCTRETKIKRAEIVIIFILTELITNCTHTNKKKKIKKTVQGHEKKKNQ